MRKNKRDNIRLLLILAILTSFAIISTSCASKQKNVKRTHVKTKIDSSGVLAKDSVLTKKEQTKTTSNIKKEAVVNSFEFEGSAGDSLQIIKRDSKGVVISHTTYTGTGKLTRKSETINNDTNTQVTKNKAVKTQIKESRKFHVNHESDTKELDKLKKTGFRWWLLWLILGLITVIFMFYEYFVE